MKRGGEARGDWERRIGVRAGAALSPAAAEAELPAPSDLVAEPGAGLVTLRWQQVAGAAGYVIFRAADPTGPFEPLDHGGSDVVAVPAPPYADTQPGDGRLHWYAVAATSEAGLPAGTRSEPVAAAALDGPALPVRVTVDAGRTVGRLDRVWQMIGSERLSQLGAGPDGFGNEIGREFRAGLALAHAELGVRSVRAHAILHDDVGVFSRNAGAPRFDFEHVDRIYDELVEIGLRPLVELSFMPRDLARDPRATVFDYRGIVSPPNDWDAWAELCARLAAHLVERYGVDEVRRWGFEVWNEPNLAVFWAGTQEEYFRLYETAARAIKGVDSRLPVGGPATAAGEWLEAFAAFVAESDVPLDFVSTHTYGNVPLDVRPTLRRYGLDGVRILWTEWGAGATHFGPIHDAPYGAPFVLRGLKATQGRLDALAYWVVSDHFEELGRPPRLFHNGFGLLTVGNLRKPRYWALKLAAELGDELLATRVEGDGAEALVDAWAARDDGGPVDVLVWNGALNAAKFAGDRALDRTVHLTISGLADGPYRVDLARVDEHHSNVARHFHGDAWPSRAQWEELHRADQLSEQRLDDLKPDRGKGEYELPVPMPGVVRLRLQERAPTGRKRREGR